MPTNLPNLDVACVVYDGLCTFEFGIVVEVFGLSRPEFDAWYRFAVCGLEPGPLRATGGVRVEADQGLEGIRHAGTVVIPGWRDPAERPPEMLLHTLREAHAHGARILSVCSGVFVLAAAGLLAGRRATTHWRYTEHLRAAYPEIRVDPDVLYVDEGSVLTSAGSAAGLDLCLHLVRHDFGAEKANVVARRLVIAPHRDGGQAQFIPKPVESRGSNGLAELMDWVRERLQDDHTIESMAARASMSTRTLARRFRESAGTTPQRWLVRERVFHAQRLLETTSFGLERVAREAGFGSAQLLRHHFRRIADTTPKAYRQTFRQRDDVGAPSQVKGQK
jgi:AraC family transcriptional regulator, transcriptional activator FtrA